MDHNKIHSRKFISFPPLNVVSLLLTFSYLSFIRLHRVWRQDSCNWKLLTVDSVPAKLCSVSHSHFLCCRRSVTFLQRVKWTRPLYRWCRNPGVACQTSRPPTSGANATRFTARSGTTPTSRGGKSLLSTHVIRFYCLNSELTRICHEY